MLVYCRRVEHTQKSTLLRNIIPSGDEEEERLVQVKVDVAGEVTVDKLVQLLLVHLHKDSVTRA